MNNTKKAFSVIELIIVVAIAAGMAAVVKPFLDEVKLEKSFKNGFESYLNMQDEIQDDLVYKFDFDLDRYQSFEPYAAVGNQGTAIYENDLIPDIDLFEKGYVMSLGGSGAYSCGTGGCGYGFYVGQADANIKNITADYNMTLALWYKHPSDFAGLSNTRVIAGIGENTNVNNDGIKIIINSGDLCAWVDGQSFCGPEVEDDLWYYLVLTLEDNGGGNVTVDFYVNGELYTQDLTGVSNDTGDEDTLGVGASCCVQYRAFGYYDEIIVVDKYIEGLMD